MVARNNDLDFDFVDRLFRYEKESGYLFHKTDTRKFKAGDRADRYISNGYRILHLPAPYGRVARAHRIAWILHTGHMPENDIDHINGDRQDNRIANLRCVDRATNLRNTSVRGRSKTGFKCVEKHGNKYIAYFTENYKKHHLGSFDTPEKAAEVARDLGWGRHLKVK